MPPPGSDNPSGERWTSRVSEFQWVRCATVSGRLVLELWWGGWLWNDLLQSLDQGPRGSFARWKGGGSVCARVQLCHT